jgi:hypothetical protein
MGLLHDLRHECVAYARDYVKVSISPVRPAVPGTVNPNEDFSFDVTVQNGSETEVMGVDAIAGVPVVDVRINLYMTQSGQLIVPAVRGVKEVRSDVSDAAVVLTPGQVVQRMWIFPVVTHLAPGERLILAGLKGRAGPLGGMVINCYAEVSVDMNWLFPRSVVGAWVSIDVV